MLAAGIPLVQAFEIVGNGNDKPAMQKLILDIKADVEGGTSLHEALAKHPLYFDDLFVNLVEAGEQAGALEVAARQDRDLQGKDRGAEEEGQEGAVLPGRGAGRRGHRHHHPADLRDSAVRGAVQGLRRRPAGLHADGHQPVALRAARRHLCRSWCWWAPCLDLLLLQEALAKRCASSSTACRSSSRSSDRSSTRRRSRATRARCRPCSRPACRWSRRSNRSPARPATSSTRTPC